MNQCPILIKYLIRLVLGHTHDKIKYGCIKKISRLQGIKLNDKLLTADDYKEIKSLHDDRKWAHNEELTWGEWVKPVWPKTRSLMG